MIPKKVRFGFFSGKKERNAPGWMGGTRLRAGGWRATATQKAGPDAERWNPTQTAEVSKKELLIIKLFNALPGQPSSWKQ